jgi:hypothetical protein
MNRRDAIKGTAMVLGYAITGTTLTSLLQSCKPEPGLSYTPLLLNDKQAKTLAAVIDRILPKTATPGALEVGVDRFIDKLLANVFPPDIQEGFAGGIDAFNQKAKVSYGNEFMKLSPSEQDQVIKTYEETSGPLPGSMWGFSFGEPEEFPFYRMMKELALIGYFTSEKIGKEYLAYNPIPGPYEGCIGYDTVGKNWTE